MDWMYILAARAAPGLAGALVTVGVAENHAEVIALGGALGVASAIEIVLRMMRGRK